MSYTVRYTNGTDSGYQPGFASSRYSTSSYRTELGSTPNLSKGYQPPSFVTTPTSPYEPIFPSAGPMANQRQYKTSTQYHSEQRYVSNSAATPANMARPTTLFQRPPPLPGFLRNSPAPPPSQRSATPLIPQITPTAKTPGSGRTTPTFVDPLANYNIPKPFDQGLLALGADLKGKSPNVMPAPEERPRGSSQPPPNFTPQQFRITPFQPGLNRYQPDSGRQQQLVTGQQSSGSRTTTVRVIPVMTQSGYVLPTQREPERQAQPQYEETPAAVNIPIQIETNFDGTNPADLQMYYSPKAEWFTTGAPDAQQQLEVEESSAPQQIYSRLQTESSRQQRQSSLPAEFRTNFTPQTADVRQIVDERMRQVEEEKSSQPQNPVIKPTAPETTAPFSSSAPYMPQQRSVPAFYKTPVPDSKMASRPMPMYSLPNDIAQPKNVHIEKPTGVAVEQKKVEVEPVEKPQTFGEKQQVLNSILKDMVLPPSFLPAKPKPTETASKTVEKVAEVNHTNESIPHTEEGKMEYPIFRP